MLDRGADRRAARIGLETIAFLLPHPLERIEPPHQRLQVHAPRAGSGSTRAADARRKTARSTGHRCDPSWCDSADCAHTLRDGCGVHHAHGVAGIGQRLTDGSRHTYPWLRDTRGARPASWRCEPGEQLRVAGGRIREGFRAHLAVRAGATRRRTPVWRYQCPVTHCLSSFSGPRRRVVICLAHSSSAPEERLSRPSDLNDATGRASGTTLGATLRCVHAQISVTDAPSRCPGIPALWECGNLTPRDSHIPTGHNLDLKMNIQERRGRRDPGHGQHGFHGSGRPYLAESGDRQPGGARLREGTRPADQHAMSESWRVDPRVAFPLSAPKARPVAGDSNGEPRTDP